MRPSKVPDIDRKNQSGFTVGVRYEKEIHKTIYTVRLDGKIIDKVMFRGEHDERTIQKTVKEITRHFREHAG